MEICNKQFLVANRWTVRPLNVLSREQLILMLSEDPDSGDRCPILTF